MALIKQIKQIKKSNVSIQVSKDLADEFTLAIDYYNKHHASTAILDFDPLIKKVVNELNKINGIDFEGNPEYKVKKSEAK